MRRERLRRLALTYPSFSLGYPFVPLKIKSNYTLKDYQARQSFLFGSTKFRTDEKGHELKAHDSFFYAEKLLV